MLPQSHQRSLWGESRMGLWLRTCRRPTFNKRGAPTTRRSSSSRMASDSGTASTSPTRTRPQRSSARVVKWRGALPPRNTRSPSFAAGDGSVRQGRLAATWPRWPTACPGQRGRFTERRKRSVLARSLAVEARSELLGLALTTLRTGRWPVFQAVVLGYRHAYLEALTTGLALELVNSHGHPTSSSK